MVTWNPTYLPALSINEPVGYTVDGKAVRWSSSAHRWLMEGLAPRIGGATSPGVETIVTAVNDLSAEVDALDLRVDSVEAELEELNMQTSMRLDTDSATAPTYAYIGRAAPGATEGAAVWRIKKLVFAVDGDVTATWADGNANFDNVWTNRAALTYT